MDLFINRHWKYLSFSHTDTQTSVGAWFTGAFSVNIWIHLRNVQKERDQFYLQQFDPQICLSETGKCWSVFEIMNNNISFSSAKSFQFKTQSLYTASHGNVLLIFITITSAHHNTLPHEVVITFLSKGICRVSTLLGRTVISCRYLITWQQCNASGASVHFHIKDQIIVVAHLPQGLTFCAFCHALLLITVVKSESQL